MSRPSWRVRSPLVLALALVLAGPPVRLAGQDAPDGEAPLSGIGLLAPAEGRHLGAFFAKWARKEPVLVAFLGGGATQGPGAGSAIGAQRFATELLPRNPDLLIIEYAGDDESLAAQGIAGCSQVIQSLEAIVRSALAKKPDMGIFLVYIPRRDQQEAFYNRRLFPPSLVAHHLVAEHYGLDEHFIGFHLAQTIEAKHFAPTAFFGEGGYLSAHGHEWVGDYIGSVRDVRVSSRTGKDGAPSVLVGFTAFARRQ